MYRTLTMAFGTLFLIAGTATTSWSQEATFLKEPERAKSNMKSSPKFDERVFVYRAVPISTEIADHNIAVKEIVLGAGATEGVHFGYVFNICLPDADECVGLAKVMELEKGRCIARVVAIDKGRAEESLKGFRAICAAPAKRYEKKSAIELGVGKIVWQTESFENKIIRGLLETADDQTPILIRQELKE